MTSIPTTGQLSLQSIGIYFGITPPYKMSQLLRGTQYIPNISINNNIPTTLNILKFSNYRGSTKALIITLSQSVENYNLYNAVVSQYGTPSGSVTVILTINAGVTVGATTTAHAALNIGQFPSGSTINVENNGNIYGAGGAGGAGGTASVGHSAGANGGNAIEANYSNQTVLITNNGTIYAGGGGGGGGAKGANGANGTNGWYATNWQYGSGQFIEPNRRWVVVSNTSVSIYFDAFSLENSTSIPINDTVYNGHYRGAYYTTNGYGRLVEYKITKTTVVLTGGTGGIGGNGGSGAAGRGYNNLTASLVGINGSSGAVGSAGQSTPDTTNYLAATSGGTGSAGVAGGTGGDWGASGVSSSGLGGSAGKYILKGSANVTFTNNGTVAGTFS